MNKTQELSFKKFIIKYTVVASVITWLIASNMKELLDIIIDSLIEPIFSIDIDNDGKPDILQAKQWITDVLGCKFPIGKILLAFVKTVIYMFIVYLCVIAIFRYTDLLM